MIYQNVTFTGFIIFSYGEGDVKYNQEEKLKDVAVVAIPCSQTSKDFLSKRNAS